MFTKTLSALLFLSVSALQADYVSEFKMSGATTMFFYKDATHYKMSNVFGDAKNEIYTIGDKTYMLTQKGDKSRIVDMAQMMEMQKVMGVDMKAAQDLAITNAEKSKENMKITKTGKKESIAGVKGEVWNVVAALNGVNTQQNIVVTNDKNVITTYKAMLSGISGMGAMMSMMEPEEGYVIVKTTDFELISMVDKKVNSSVYALPKDSKVEDLSAVINMYKK